MRSFVLTGLVLLFALSDVFAQAPPSEKSGAIRLAEAASKKLDADEHAWHELTAKLAAAVSAYNPHSIDFLPEAEALDALKRYAEKVLESGKQVVALHDKWAAASGDLADTLRKCPAYYRAAAKDMRAKGEATRFSAVKDRYFVAADIWLALAEKGERRLKELNLEDGGGGSVMGLVRAENQFTADFLSTLNALPRVSGKDSAEYKELLEALRRHAARSDELHRQLRAFRDRLKGEEPAPAEKEASPRKPK
jgi:hypothetical protein